MSEMIIQRESLTAIADEIRILSGTEGTMGLDAMKSNVSEANANVDTEADLIAQISAALEGKTGSGGSGANVETCTVVISGHPSNASCAITRYVDDEFIVTHSMPSNSTFYNVVCGSGIYVNGVFVVAEVTAGTVLSCGNGFVYQVPMSPSELVTITLTQG